MIRKYVLNFSLAYLIIIISLLVVSQFIDFPGSVSSIVSLFSAAVYASSKFVMDQKRIPSVSEKRKLVWWCLLSSVVLSTSVVLTFIIFDIGFDSFMDMIGILLDQLSLWIIAISIVISLLIQYLALSYSFGSFTKGMLKKIEKSS